MMTHLDLFTGVGGFHLAAQWAGFQTIGFAEIEPYCCKLLAQKWPEIANYGDIRTADFSLLRGSVTVLSAGVPCQPASLAGKRRGADDDRWLWEAVLDVIGDVEPAWVVLENPPGIVSIHAFRDILLCLGDLGYEIRLFSVPANAIGANHIRERIFIVANAAGIGRNGRRSGEFGYMVDPEEKTPRRRGRAAGLCSFFRHIDCSRLAQWQSEQGNNGSQFASTTRANRPEFNPELLREIHGVRNRRDRIKALGNAVVPQQAYPFFAAIAQVETALT